MKEALAGNRNDEAPGCSLEMREKKDLLTTPHNQREEKKK
jgi:hypothetical protein